MNTDNTDKYTNNAASSSGLTWSKTQTTDKERAPAMNPKEILTAAAALIDDRGVNYGGIEANFERAAKLATLKLDKNVSAYDVAIVMESVKDARRATCPDHYDSHIDGINYRAFALMLSGADKDRATVQEMIVKLSRDEADAPR
jgi:hypothetical protein